MTLTPDRTDAGAAPARRLGTLEALDRALDAADVASAALGEARLALGTARGWVACGIFLEAGPLRATTQEQSMQQANVALDTAAAAVTALALCVADTGLAPRVDLPDPMALRIADSESETSSAVELRAHIAHAQDTARAAEALIAHAGQVLGEERAEVVSRTRQERIRRTTAMTEMRSQRWGKLLTRARVAGR